jgi:predicted metal-binding protein
MTLFSHFKIDDRLANSLKKAGTHIPTYNIFDDKDAFQFEERSYVNENLIPVVEYKITVNKESLHQHQTEWKHIFSTHYGKVLVCPPKWDSILIQQYILQGIVEKFRRYILEPIVELQRKTVEEKGK